MKNINSNKLVSIITPCYNSENYIEETINSVLSQTYSNIEYIIIDDGSTDDSWRIISSYKNKLKCFRTKNFGGGYARNFGVKKSSGSYFMFLDSDDIISRDLIENLIKTSLNNQQCIIGNSWARIIKTSSGWEEVRSDLPLYPKINIINAWLTGWYIPPCAILWPKNIYNIVGGWDESLTANQDGDLMLRSFLLGFNIKISEKGKSFYRKHGPNHISISSDLVSESSLFSRVKVLKKVIKSINDSNKHNINLHREYIGTAFHKLARNNMLSNRKVALDCINKWKYYSKGKIPGSLFHKLAVSLIGLETKEKLAHSLYKLGFSNKKRKVFSIRYKNYEKKLK
jgi:O-antigen biosynthesis protein